MRLLTLIIPTYNRPNFLKRILDYYSQNNINFDIIVADSSTQQNKEINRKVVQSFPNLKILYLHKFSSKLVSHQKFAQMVNYIKTKYCVFCADDDFVVPDGINEAVVFLEENPDYSAAHGSYIHFYLHTNSMGVKKFWWNFIYPYESITSSNAVTRMTSHFNKYNQVMYAVRRTNVVLKVYKEFIKYKIDPFLFGEFLPDMLTIIYGKIKRLNMFYAARQAFSTSSSYWPSLMDATNKGAYDKEYAKFKECLISNMIKNTKLSKKEIQLIIDTNMSAYLKTTLQQHLFGKFNNILRRFPSFIVHKIRALHARYLFSKEKKDRIGLIDKPTSRYYQYFHSIKTLVLKI